MALILGGDAPFVSESGEQQNLAALRRAAYDLEHSALETLRAVAVVLYEKRLASGRAPADFRLRDDHACVAMTLTRRKNGRKCLRALGLQRIGGVWRETNRADRAPRLGGEVVAVGAAAEARPEDEDAAEARDMAPLSGDAGDDDGERPGGARRRGRATARTRATGSRATPLRAQRRHGLRRGVGGHLPEARRGRGARDAAAAAPPAGKKAKKAPARAARAKRARRAATAAKGVAGGGGAGGSALRRGDVCAVSRRRLEAPSSASPARAAGPSSWATTCAAPALARRTASRQVRKKAPGPLKGFDAPSEANGERCCVYFDAAKKRWCLGRAGLGGRLRLLARRPPSARAWHAFSADKGDAGGGFELESSWSVACVDVCDAAWPRLEGGSSNARYPVVVAEDRVAGCDDVAAVWVGATHKTYVPRAALAPLPHGEALAFLVESGGAAAGAPAAASPRRPGRRRRSPRPPRSWRRSAPRRPSARRRSRRRRQRARTVMPGGGDSDGDDDDDGDKDDGDGEKPAEAPEPAAAAPKAKTASTKRRATEDDDGDSVVDAKEWTYKTDQERRVEREDGVLCDEAHGRRALDRAGQGAARRARRRRLQPRLRLRPRSAGGKAGWRSRVAPELLGVQFDGANFTVVHLPDEGVTDPHAVVSHDPARGPRRLGRSDNVSPTALERRAKNRDRAFGDVDPWFGQQRLDDDELAFGTAANAAGGARPRARQAQARKDRSSCLVLPPKHWLELAPTDVPTNNGWVRGLNDYTVVVDVKFEKPLEAAFAALQPQARQGGGACHFLPPAAPGASGGVGVARRRVDASRAATLRARRWNRVVIAVEAQWEKGRKVKVYVNSAPSRGLLER
ncbi:hypothetical protein JL720_16063 [Aureococcus anophagefferens]|nr:hypothetical protein JL720_16063 [Aureococcus anophagefferens]